MTAEREMRKAFLISIASSCLLLFIGASVQGAYTYTTLDVSGTIHTDHPP